jgi:small neutral amino acid transporter SnatA (MarC family)
MNSSNPTPIKLASHDVVSLNLPRCAAFGTHTTRHQKARITMLKPHEERQSCFATIAGILFMFLFTYILYQAALFLTNSLNFSDRTALAIIAVMVIILSISFYVFSLKILDMLEKYLNKTNWLK